MTQKPVRRYEAAGGVVVRDGRVLLLRRAARGEVRLPKGHVEAGESPEAAALREVREEAGFARPRIVADLGRQQVEFDFVGDHVVRGETYYLMALDDPAPFPRDPDDAAEFEPFWVTLAEAEERLTFPAEREVVRRAGAVLGKTEETRRSPAC